MENETKKFKYYLGNNIIENNRSSYNDYEARFFLFFAKEVESLFNKMDWSGVLLGWPVVRNEPRMGADCILLTEYIVIIFEFKNYEGIIELPNEPEFESATWYSSYNEIKPVSGGYSKNPFEQLDKKRNYLSKSIGVECYERIKTFVIFQHEIQIKGEIPNKHKEYFEICDFSNFIEKIKNKINRHKEIYFENRININDLFTHFDAGQLQGGKIKINRYPTGTPERQPPTCNPTVNVKLPEEPIINKPPKKPIKKNIYLGTISLIFIIVSVFLIMQRNVPDIMPVVYITMTGRTYHLDSCRHLSDSKIAINLYNVVAERFRACVECEPPEIGVPKEEVLVYRTPTGRAYHRRNCTSSGNNTTRILLTEAERARLTPCRTCNPPTD
ncbi:MAG: NERD domain-containing protein [Candidatus Cloacimonetes bacterium]|nr:NERD domain-containing protein [Candidatus Cloacimonadota bacterium]